MEPTLALGALGGKAPGTNGNGIAPIIGAPGGMRRRGSGNAQSSLWAAAAQGDTARLRRWFALPRTLRPRALQGGADARDLVTGFTALMLASVNGHVEAARVLLENGASPDAVEAGQSALALAAANARADVVRLLLQCGADATFTSGRHGMTPLQLAAGSGSTATVAALLDGDDGGADDRRGMGRAGQGAGGAGAGGDHAAVLAAGHPPYQFDSDAVNRLLEQRYDAHIRAVVDRVFQPELARNGGMVPVTSVLDRKYPKKKERAVLNRLRELSKEYR